MPPPHKKKKISAKVPCLIPGDTVEYRQGDSLQRVLIISFSEWGDHGGGERYKVLALQDDWHGIYVKPEISHYWTYFPKDKRYKVFPR
jgi:hypothetical protein